MSDLDIPILFEDRHLLVVNKPPGLVCHEDAHHSYSVRSVLAKKIAQERGRASAFLTPAHRLDRGTSGALVLAKTSKALSRLTQSLGAKEIDPGRSTKKSYHFLALASCDAIKRLPLSKMTWEDHLLKKQHYSSIVSEHTPGAKRALCTASVLRNSDDSLHLNKVLEIAPDVLKPLFHSLIGKVQLVKVKIELQTGRYHQIRLQAAARGLWILGDWRYFFLFLKDNSHHFQQALSTPASLRKLFDSSKSVEHRQSLWYDFLQNDQIAGSQCPHPVYLHAHELALELPVNSQSFEDGVKRDKGDLITVTAPYPKNLPLWSLL